MRARQGGGPPADECFVDAVGGGVKWAMRLLVLLLLLRQRLFHLYVIGVVQEGGVGEG